MGRCRLQVIASRHDRDRALRLPSGDGSLLTIVPSAAACADEAVVTWPCVTHECVTTGRSCWKRVETERCCMSGQQGSLGEGGQPHHQDPGVRLLAGQHCRCNDVSFAALGTCAYAQRLAGEIPVIRRGPRALAARDRRGVFRVLVWSVCLVKRLVVSSALLWKLDSISSHQGRRMTLHAPPLSMNERSTYNAVRAWSYGSVGAGMSMKNSDRRYRRAPGDPKAKDRLRFYAFPTRNVRPTPPNLPTILFHWSASYPHPQRRFM